MKMYAKLECSLNQVFIKSRIYFFSIFICHNGPTYQTVMFLCPKLCLLAHIALLRNKRASKRGKNANFQKSLKSPRNGVIKTLCAKNQVCKSIGVTCSTYRRFTKDKEENTRKWPKKGPQRAKNQNFEKQKIAFFSHVPRSIMSKN